MSEELIHPIPPNIEKALAQLLASDETVYIKMKGAFKEVLVCTNKRVVILKTGFMTGQMFGLKQFQMPLEMITSAEVNATLGMGFIEISAGGVQNTPKSYWGSGNKSAQEAPNCVSISGADLVSRFRRASTIILEKAAEARNQNINRLASPPADVTEALTNLWKLKNEGALSNLEYEAAKARVLNS